MVILDNLNDPYQKSKMKGNGIVEETVARLEKSKVTCGPESFENIFICGVLLEVYR